VKNVGLKKLRFRKRGDLEKYVHCELQKTAKV
jgi:hypothetical protein